MRRLCIAFRPLPGLRFALLAVGSSPTAIWPALAQEVHQPVEVATPDAQPDDIIVTARRRSEKLQRVPVSVIALSDKDLESRSVTNLRAVQDFVPNLTFAPSQNVGEAASNIFIRGIGQEDFGVGAEPGVGFYVDGVYFARSLGTIMNVTDVVRIEVLRGPQGTLYGRNTIGGAVNVVSAVPRPERERRFSIILGNHDRVELRGISNERLSNRLFARLAVTLVRRDGYVRRLQPVGPLALLEQVNKADVDLRREGDDRNEAGRLQLRWPVTDTLTVDFSLDASRRSNSQGATHLDALKLNAGIFPQINQLIQQGKLPGPELTEEFPTDDLLESHAAGRNETNQKFWGAAAVITKELGADSLKFIGAYRGLSSRIGTDPDGLHFDIAEGDFRVNHRQFSAELQWNGDTGGLSYTAGLFAFSERPEILPDIAPGILFTCGCFFAPGGEPPLTINPRTLSNTSYAAYAQGTYGITDRLSATLGARYSHERKSVEGKVILLDSSLRPTSIVLGSGEKEGSWNPFTYRVGLEYQATPDVMIYGSIARGYKSGGFNVRSALNLPNLGFHSFKPESALTYELGLRSLWFRRRLRVNATLFHTDYRNIQLRQQTIADGVNTTLIENAASARIRGGEFELMATPASGLKISVAYGHLSARYLDVGQVPGLTLRSRFQRSPSHSLSASINYELAVREGTIELHADYSYRSKEQFQILPALNDQKGYGLLGARATFRTMDGGWAFALFGTNLADERYRTAGRGTLLDQAGIAYSSIGLPRQLGLQITKAL